MADCSCGHTRREHNNTPEDVFPYHCQVHGCDCVAFEDAPTNASAEEDHKIGSHDVLRALTVLERYAPAHIAAEVCPIIRAREAENQALRRACEAAVKLADDSRKRINPCPQPHKAFLDWRDEVLAALAHLRRVTEKL